jgi:hypothetical protein
MARNEVTACTRRSFLGKSLVAGTEASALTIIKPELVRGAGKERLRAGLVGCGGRATEAAIDLLTADSNVELVSIGDIFEDKLRKSLTNLRDAQFLMDASRNTQPNSLASLWRSWWILCAGESTLIRNTASSALMGTGGL